MAKINLFAVTPPTDIYDPTKPTQQTEFLSWVISKNLENMQAAGLMLDDGQIESNTLNNLWLSQNDIIVNIQTAFNNFYNNYGSGWIVRRFNNYV
jgi:hypothetical protein